MIAAIEHQCCLCAEKCSEFRLQLFVNPEVPRQQAGGGGSRQEGVRCQCLQEFFLQLAVGSQAQVIVGRKVQHMPAIGYNRASLVCQLRQAAQVAVFFQCLQLLLHIVSYVHKFLI